MHRVLLCALLLLLGCAHASHDPLLSDDTRNGVVHAAKICMGERAVEMFQELRQFTIVDTKNEDYIRESDYYIIRFFEQYIADIEMGMCDAVLKATETARYRIRVRRLGLSATAKQRIGEICKAHTFQIPASLYYGSMDTIPLCMHRMIDSVMQSAYSHS